MKIATWNINSVKLRLPLLLDWLDDQRPDILVLQEIKCMDDQFPREAIEDAGYCVQVHGQKSYNGVALLSRQAPEETTFGLATFPDDEQARYIESLFVDEALGSFRIGGLYCPNGNPFPGEKFDYKLTWMKALADHAASCLAREETLILLGDFNVIPGDLDCYHPDSWRNDALFRPETLAIWRQLLNLGLTDALTAWGLEGHYTFWDYQAGAWPKNQGIRIDHLLLSSRALDRLLSVEVDKTMRAREKPSDHVPVIATFGLSGQ